MLKLLWLLVLAALACKLLTRRWPWELIGRTGGLAREKRARALLGVAENAGYTDIVEAHRRLVTLVHPDRGGTNEQIHEANAARDLLLGSLRKDRIGK
jgi:DnaJ homolog subfamily C member 19